MWAGEVSNKWKLPSLVWKDKSQNQLMSNPVHIRVFHNTPGISYCRFLKEFTPQDRWSLVMVSITCTLNMLKRDFLLGIYTVSKDRFHCILTSECLNQERDKISLGWKLAKETSQPCGIGSMPNLTGKLAHLQLLPLSDIHGTLWVHQIHCYSSVNELGL